MWNRKYVLAMDFNCFIDQYINPQSVQDTSQYEHLVLSLACVRKIIRDEHNQCQFYLHTVDRISRQAMSKKNKHINRKKSPHSQFLQFRCDTAQQRNEWCEELEYQFQIVYELLKLRCIRLRVADANGSLWLPTPHLPSVPPVDDTLSSSSPSHLYPIVTTFANPRSNQPTCTTHKSTAIQSSSVHSASSPSSSPSSPSPAPSFTTPMSLSTNASPSLSLSVSPSPVLAALPAPEIPPTHCHHDDSNTTITPPGPLNRVSLKPMTNANGSKPNIGTALTSLMTRPQKQRHVIHSDVHKKKGTNETAKIHSHTCHNPIPNFVDTRQTDHIHAPCYSYPRQQHHHPVLSSHVPLISPDTQNCMPSCQYTNCSSMFNLPMPTCSKSFPRRGHAHTRRTNDVPPISIDRKQRKKDVGREKKTTKGMEKNTCKEKVNKKFAE
ncbi:voltage gated chloride channel domain-containing protein [Reticulomyxa filosa]|uniref:Voltage gated chloride channel domain-containing protein n=1 Tax=Reticulomyxa filosa TaxID=46433 RepID=X6NGN0_RETFI|nr:voltage gated chloride channel domain-containing protein [Reticulomyxa filosa]|eukprot:ETO24864.1 voltage gated chloride channel domain-containing protein [Reticulomyxa filosa]